MSSNEELHIKCVLVPGQEITAILSTVADFSDINNIEYPEDARIYLITNIDTPFEFKYDSIRNLYYIPPTLHKANAGWPYEIRAYLKSDPDKRELQATTKFHPAAQLAIEKAELLTDKGSTRLFGTFSLDKETTRFYRINAKYTDLAEGQAYTMRFLGNNEDPLAFYHNQFTEGIYVDIDRVDHRQFTMDFEFDHQMDEIHQDVTFEMEAISEDLYRYEIARAKQIGAIQSGNYEPVVNYTNIVNGLGLFGTSSMSKQVLPIN